MPHFYRITTDRTRVFAKPVLALAGVACLLLEPILRLTLILVEACACAAAAPLAGLAVDLNPRSTMGGVRATLSGARTLSLRPLSVARIWCEWHEWHLRERRDLQDCNRPST